MHASGAAAPAENSQPRIQSRPLVRKLTFPPAGVRYVALPSSSGPPEHPRGQAASTRALSVAGPLLFAVLEMIDNEIFADRDDANGPNEEAANWGGLTFTLLQAAQSAPVGPNQAARPVRQLSI